MTYAVKNLVNAVKKALDKKASFAAGYNAYANSNGDLIARDIRDCNTDITVFVAGIVEDVTKREKIYSIDALTLAADTGIFAGGVETPENFAEYYEIPAENFREVVTISGDDLKAAAYSLSKDGSRPILTGIHLATAADFLHISKVLFELGYTSYTDENGRPHFKKQDTENKLTTFVVFDPYLEV